MTFVLWTLVGASCLGATAVVAYAAGARCAWYRGVAYGQHVAGREMMHVLACADSGQPLRPASLDDIRPPRRSN